MKKILVSLLIMQCIFFLCSCNKEGSVGIQRETLHTSWAIYYDSVQDLRNNSDIIAVIEVIDVEKVYYLGESPIPFTVFETEVKQVIWGSTENETLYIGQTGMMDETRIIEIEDDPLMNVGCEYLIFARGNSDGTYTILSGHQGRYLHEQGYVSPVVEPGIGASSAYVTSTSNAIQEGDMPLPTQTIPIKQIVDEITEGVQ